MSKNKRVRDILTCVLRGVSNTDVELVGDLVFMPDNNGFLVIIQTSHTSKKGGGVP